MSGDEDDGHIGRYGFNEPGTWGYCSGCDFVVTLAEDGFIATHERRHSAGYGNTVSVAACCPGSRTEPVTNYKTEREKLRWKETL